LDKFNVFVSELKLNRAGLPGVRSLLITDSIANLF